MSRTGKKRIRGISNASLKNIYQIHKLRQKKKKENRNNRPCPRSGVAKKETYNKARTLHCARYL